MTERDIIQLAAILVNEHGHLAPEIAQRRRSQHEQEPHSDGFRLWTRIAAATDRLLRLREASRAADTPSWRPRTPPVSAGAKRA
jgi:hypothetical protein